MPHKPFPWYCTHCKTASVEPKRGRYEFTQKHDGRESPIVIEDVDIPTCGKCGHRVLDRSTLERITEQTYVQLGLLTPQQIRAQREGLRLTQQQMQELLGLGGNTLSRWETGHVYQSRALDRFLRVFFADDRVRQMLEIEDWTLPLAPVEKSAEERFAHLKGRSKPPHPTITVAEFLCIASQGG